MRQNFLRVQKKSKYKNIKCSCDGYKFDSVGEMNCYKWLKLREHAGEIQIEALQPKIYLSDAKILYKPDFVIKDLKEQRTIYLDYKGMKTAVFQIKKRLWKAYGPGELQLIEGTDLRMSIVERITSNSQ